jgi:hypothetical protein
MSVVMSVKRERIDIGNANNFAANVGIGDANYSNTAVNNPDL